MRCIIRTLFSVALFISTSPCIAQTSANKGKPAESPSDAEVQAQIKQLDRSNPETVRLEATKWLNERHRSPNAKLAIPALEKCIRSDPSWEVRQEAVLGLSAIAKKQKQPCPLAIIEAYLDSDLMVRQFASGRASLFFDDFAPGSLTVMLKCAESDDEQTRSACLDVLGKLARSDKRALAAIDMATKDKKFGVRHNAHVAKFAATNNLENYLLYLIRLQVDRDDVLGHLNTETEDGKRDLVTWEMAALGSACTIVGWTESRPNDLVAALLKHSESPTPDIRRGATRLIGASALKVDLSELGTNATDKKPAKDSRLPEPSKAVPVLEKLKATERLRHLRDNDPDSGVRSAAKTALEHIASVQPKDGMNNR